MKVNQTGFSVVEILIVLVLIVLVGTVGWLVYDRQNNRSSDNEVNNTQVNTPQAYKRTTTAPKDWKTYRNEAYKITAAYPSEWTVEDSVFSKKAGHEEQNVYSINATTIFVICYKAPDANQWCSAQININNQPFAQSLVQLREYYSSNANDTPYQETALTIDGHEAVEFRTEMKGGYPTQREYLVNANGFSYGLTTVYEGEPKDDSGRQQLSAKDSLTLFESIKIE